MHDRPIAQAVLERGEDTREQSPDGVDRVQQHQPGDTGAVAGSRLKAGGRVRDHGSPGGVPHHRPDRGRTDADAAGLRQTHLDRARDGQARGGEPRRIVHRTPRPPPGDVRSHHGDAVAGEQLCEPSKRSGSPGEAVLHPGPSARLADWRGPCRAHPTAHGYVEVEHEVGGVVAGRHCPSLLHPGAWSRRDICA